MTFRQTLQYVAAQLTLHGNHEDAETLQVLARQPMDVERSRQWQINEDIETLRQQLHTVEDPTHLKETVKKIKDLKGKRKMKIGRPYRISKTSPMPPNTVSK